MAPSISDETQRRIEEGLRTWNDPDSPARLRFEAARREMDERYRHITEAIEASERITAEDLAVYINTRA